MQSYKEGKVIFINFLKFDLYAETPNVPGRRSKLSFGVRDGNPRITVFTNDPSDTINKGVIYAPFSPEVFLAFLDMFEKAILNGNDTKYKIDCLTYARDESGKADLTTKVPTSQLWFGKDKTGICWMSVVSGNRPKIPFQFKLSEFHNFYHANGEKFSESENSDVVALATVRGLRQIIHNMIAEYSKSFEQDAVVRSRPGAKPAAKAPVDSFEEDPLF